MHKKIQDIITKVDIFLYKKFGWEKKLYFLENLPEANIIFSQLNGTESKSKVKFVGGCVRKALSEDQIDDIDLSTTLKPEEVKEKLNQKKIRVIDTGISHGTVTAILNAKKFEITTLRKDLSTDGRHANVLFTSDWEQDAKRRDFTINAIYADIDGRIFDPLNGMKDLKNGKVKFIGSSQERIQEDYLRILRYFRFFIQYSNEDYNEDTIRFIKQNINGLNKVSNERIFIELKKILSIKNINNLFSNQQSKEIILNIFPQFKYYERLNTINKKFKNKYDNFLILALLITDESNNYEYFCHKYKLSNSIKKRFFNISKNYENLKIKKFYSKFNVRKLMYLLNKNEVKDLLLFSLCINNKKVQVSVIEELIETIDVFKIPKFPISGDYLKEKGYKTGEALGAKLKLLEEKWINNNFYLDKKLIETSLGKINNKN